MFNRCVTRGNPADGCSGAQSTWHESVSESRRHDRPPTPPYLYRRKRLRLMPQVTTADARIAYFFRRCCDFGEYRRSQCDIVRDFRFSISDGELIMDVCWKLDRFSIIFRHKWSEIFYKNIENRECCVSEIRKIMWKL